MIEKIVTLKEIKDIVQALRKAGKRIVTTNGTFDILHLGHLRGLEEGRALGDVLIVGLNSDSSVKQYKSDMRPVMPEGERAEMLAGLSCVDYIVIFSETNPENFLEAVKPDIHTKGQGVNPDYLPEAEVVIRNGGTVVRTKQIVGVSTTNLIEKVLMVYGPTHNN